MGDQKMDLETKLPENVEEWTTAHVVQWASTKINPDHAKKLEAQEVDGRSLLDAALVPDRATLERWGIPGIPAAQLMNAIEGLRGAKTQGSNSCSAPPFHPPSPYWFRSDRSISDIIGLWKKKNVVLLRSPPFTGKTFFAELLQRSDALRGKIVYHVNLVETDGDSSSTVEELWQRKSPPCSLAEFVSRNRESYLFFDEVQANYRNKDSILWKILKQCIDTTSLLNVKILCLAGYGSQSMQTQAGTPIQFNVGSGATLSLKFLKLNEEDIIVICNDFSKITALQFTSEGRDVLWRTTNGHRGFLYVLLKKREEFHEEKKWQKFIDSLQMHNLILSSRALAGFSKQQLNEKQLSTLRDVVLFKQVRWHEDDQDISLLVKLGYLTSTDDDANLIFSCPLISKSVQIRIFSGTPVEKIPEGGLTIENFLIAAFHKLRKSHLSHTISRNVGDGSVSEKFWQSEFYYASSSSLPADVFVSSEVGAWKNIKGIIDFIVDNLNWGIELLIEKNELQEHLDRFHLVGGKYRPAHFSQYAIVDFIKKDEKWLNDYFPDESERTQRANKRRKLDENVFNHYWTVFYAQDFSKLWVFFKDTKIEIPLSQ